MQEFIKAAKAVSDETRLRILSILLVRECCVCEVMQSLDISQTRASRNLSILYEAGFLNVRKDGLWVLYSIDKNGISKNNKKHLALMLQSAETYFEKDKTAAADIKRLEKANRVYPTCS